MCTKFWSDGDVHKYFSPYDSPYDAYIFYMNVLADFESTLEASYKKNQESASSKGNSDQKNTTLIAENGKAPSKRGRKKVS
jgi:alpha-amylase